MAPYALSAYAPLVPDEPTTHLSPLGTRPTQASNAWAR
jgi:hypothetical protein